ncbi:MAG: MotA/TolQ/ExbB proton channel family protein [Gammaproteobacteria bacterium]|nr:MotA/TolQ/ExbB proton channel family protein [Gammaproteobacteria bacterium]
MWPILICSIISLAIIAERFWSLRTNKICPKNLVSQVWELNKKGQLDVKQIQKLKRDSQLGRILAAGLVNRHHERHIMKESVEEVGRHVVHELGRFLNTLGTIASVSPLLGLLGTVIGMIKVFTVITTMGLGDPAVLAEGISVALITTATGLTVAIPSLMFYRYFHGKIDELVITMEQEALKMVEVMHGQREKDTSNG